MVPGLYLVLTSVSLLLSVFSPVVGHYCLCSEEEEEEEEEANVSFEQALQPLGGEVLPPSANKAQEACVDIKAGAFWYEKRHKAASCDVRVFHPHARLYRICTLPQMY